jgi:hypothetical protein
MKATNEDAIALEIEKTPTLGGVVFKGHFKGDVEISRTVPKIVLWKSFLQSRLMGFPQELVFLSEHPDMIEELTKLCSDIKDKKVSVLLESPVGLDYIENPERPIRQTTNIRLNTDGDKAQIWFNSSNIVVVDKKEFLEELKKLLE